MRHDVICGAIIAKPSNIKYSIILLGVIKLFGADSLWISIIIGWIGRNATDVAADNIIGNVNWGTITILHLGIVNLR